MWLKRIVREQAILFESKLISVLFSIKKRIKNVKKLICDYILFLIHLKKSLFIQLFATKHTKKESISITRIKTTIILKKYSSFILEKISNHLLNSSSDI